MARVYGAHHAHIAEVAETGFDWTRIDLKVAERLILCDVSHHDVAAAVAHGVTLHSTYPIHVSDAHRYGAQAAIVAEETIQRGDMRVSSEELQQWQDLTNAQMENETAWDVSFEP